jgi:hypothetical protein
LQAAFATVSAGSLPLGYPQIGMGWKVPASLLKAVAWTESRWQQFVSPGHTLVSFDGGYGLMQITSGMGDGGLPPITESAIANNYLYNLAFGAQLLVEKLLKTPNIGDDDPSIMEHWYYALWAYNGWGWVNNPNNLRFTRIGTPATNPTAFPYQERVFYWLAHPPAGPDGQTLWPAIPVTLPDPKEIGVNPGPLPEVATPHTDIAVPESGISLGADVSVLFLKDLTIPDDTTVAPGQRFRKVWLMRNDGSIGWTEGYRWMPVAGPALGAPQGVVIGGIPPLADVAVAVNLIAPTQPGIYQSYWQMIDPHGTAFGTRVWVKIRVAGADSIANTDVRTATAPATGAQTPVILAQAGLTTAGRSQPASKVGAPSNGEFATYDGDVDVPDGTVFAPGTHFVKTWRIKNAGTITWSPAFHWHFEAGTLMSSIMGVSAPTTAPGYSAVFSVPMMAPLQTGVYTSFWQMTDAVGMPFPMQAWVSIVVRRGHQGAPRATPQATATARAMLTASPTPTHQPSTTPTETPVARHAPTSTITPSPTQTPTSVATLFTQPSVASPAPTMDLPGGNGALAGSPWQGALIYRTFFAAGTTKGTAHETLGFYDPGSGVAHVVLTVYRPDGAFRTFTFTLNARAWQAIPLNAVAPGTGLASMVEADRQIVVTRVQWTAHSFMTDPGAARTARYWYFGAVPKQAPGNSRLVFFNPHDVAVPVAISIGLPAGGCCAAHVNLSVPPYKQFEYQPGAPGLLDGPMSLVAGDAIAVERVAEAPDHLAEVEVPGGAAPSTHWYLPVAHSDKGGLVTIFNPGSAAATVRIQLFLDEGPANWLQRTVPPFSELDVPVDRLTHLELIATSVTASAPVLAGALWYANSGQPAAYSGVDLAGKTWAILTGLSEAGVADTLELQNPTTTHVTATISLSGPKGTHHSWHITLPPRSRYATIINTMAPPGPALVLVQGSGPLIASHTLTAIFGSSTAPGASLP